MFLSVFGVCILEEWREQLKNKPIRYWSRIEIEEIVKEYRVDRNRFYEYSKIEYLKVLKKFYYSFADYKNYPDVQLSYVWLNLRKNLKRKFFQYDTDWLKMLHNVKQYFIRQGSQKLFLILSDGWVYEGYIDEMITVLSEIDGIIEDFYIVTQKFDSFAVYCTDGDCVIIYEK